MLKSAWWDNRRETLKKRIRVDSANWAQRMINQLRVADQLRHDAGETGALQLALEAMMTEAFDIEYPESLALRYLPVDDTVAPGAVTVAYKQGETYGSAQVISNHADDLPLVERTLKKYPQVVLPFGAAYQITTQELLGAAMQQIPIEADKARDVRAAHDRFLDDLAFSGNTEYGLEGIANHSSIPLETAITGTWSAATAEQILNDALALIDAVNVNTLQILRADTLLVGTVQYGYLGRPRADSSDTSIRDWILKNRPEIKTIAPWWRLDTADAAGTGPRMIAMAQRPDVCRLRITLPFTQEPPQYRNLAYIVNCHMRSAGLLMLKPLGIAHMDGC